MKSKTLQKKYGKVIEVEIKDGPKRTLINRGKRFVSAFFYLFF
jgi:hypothetical protein